MQTYADILKVLRRVIRRLPAAVVELRGKPIIDRDGNEMVYVTVTIADTAIDKMLVQDNGQAIRWRLREAFSKARIEDWVHTRFCTASELREIAAYEERDLAPQCRPVRVVRRRRARRKNAAAARRPRVRAARRKAS